MLKVQKLIVGQLQTNCYIVAREAGHEAVVIDPGDDADYIARAISDMDLEPMAILATHAHYDHILAANELKMAFMIPFLMSKKDEFLLRRMKSSAKLYSKITTDPPPKIDKYLESVSKLKIGNCELQIIPTPGHTPGSLSFYSKKEGVVFSGDLIFSQGAVGRSDFSYSKEEDLKDSIEAILSLPSKTRILPGHGDETTVRQARLYNYYN